MDVNVIRRLGTVYLVLSVVCVCWSPDGADCDHRVQDEWPPSWPNHGGGIDNRRDAPFEKKLSPLTLSHLSLKWTFTTEFSVIATPAIDARRGVVYFPSYDGCQYAVKRSTGELIWKANLTEIASTIPGLVESNIVLPSLKNSTDVKGLGDVASRATPTIAGSLLVFGLYNPCYVLALDRKTGALAWWSKVASHPFCVFTQSGTYYEGSVYIGLSSVEDEVPPEICCTFRGEFFKLDAKTGKLLWTVPMLRDNGGRIGLYAGASVWGSSPAIDAARRLVYIATGNAYSVPPEVEGCEVERRKNPNPPFVDYCIADDDHSESILAIDIDEGKIAWATHLGAYDTFTTVCAGSPVPLPNCPKIIGNDYDFGEAPFLFSAGDKDLVVAGQKSGVVHALERSTGRIIWQTDAGPGGYLGGAAWGMTTDGERVFTNINNYEGSNFTLAPSTKVINWGGWVCMNGTTGEILWSAANPSPFPAKPALAYANGVVFGGSIGNSSVGIPGELVALKATTGEVLWSYKIDGTLAGGPSIFNGCLYQPTGTLSLTDLTGFSTIALCIPPSK